MTLFSEGVEMNAAAVNLSMVSNGLFTSPFKSAEALSIESLNFFNQIFQLNCSLVRDSMDTQLACFGKILHENNLEKSNEVIVDHVKLIPKEPVSLPMWELQTRWTVSASWLRVW
jgi:hypothetical protein